MYILRFFKFNNKEKKIKISEFNFIKVFTIDKKKIFKFFIDKI